MAANNVRNEYEALASSIQGRLQQQSPLRAQHSIFRVPDVLRNGNDKVYVPQLLSIGPLNRGLNLQTMERIKSWYLHCLLERNPTPNTGLHHFVKAIKDIEQNCRDCYEEQIDLSSDQFVEIMVVDGCFIVELFRKFSGLVPKADEDPLFCRSWMQATLINDLLLLENQLPWIVLNCLFDLTRETASVNHPLSPSLPELTLRYFKEYTLGKHPRVDAALECKHLLDFTRNSLLGSVEQLGSGDFHCFPIPSVLEMAQAGIFFNCGKEDDMLNITFNDGVLEIPPLRVYKNGESFLRNLIAYEQCAPSAASKMTSYAILLQHLIRSEEDLELLIKHGIIETSFCKDISWFLNPILSTDIRVYDFSYAKLYEELYGYFQTPWNLRRKTLKILYFKDPSTTLNLTIAIGLVTVLTIIQTVYAIVSYHKPS